MALDTPDGGNAAPATALPNATTDAPVEQQSNMPTGDLQPPANAPAPQPPVKMQPASQPAPSRVFFKAVAHALGGGVLGVLAGPDPVDYKTNETGEQVAVPRKQTNITRLQRVAQAALTGLAAGAEAPRRPGANALAGLGAGFTAEQSKLQQQDVLARKQDRENFEQQQKLLTDKAIRAGHNAATFALHQKSQQEANDHDPERKIGLAIQAGAEDFIKRNPGTTMTAKVVSADQAHAMVAADPHTIGDYAFYPLGMRDVKDADGNLVYEQDGITPKQEGQILAIGGGREAGIKAGKIPVPQEIITQAKKFEGLIPGLNLRGVNAGDEMPMDRFFALTKTLAEAEGRKMDGWKEAKVGDNAVIAPGPDGKPMKMQRNSFDGELRPYGGVPNIEDKPAKEAAEIAEKGALTEKAKADTAKTEEETKQLKEWNTGGPNGTGRIDVFGNPVGAPGMDRKEYLKRVDTYTKDYSKDLNQLDAARSQLSDIITNAEKTKKLPGADAVVGIFDAIGISSAPLKGRGFRINNSVVSEHVEGTRNAWQNMALKLSRLTPEGTGQIVSLDQLKDYERIMDQARNDAYIGAANDAVNRGIGIQNVPRGNGRAIDASTMDIFLTLAKGDPKIASSTAKQYGWAPPAAR